MQLKVRLMLHWSVKRMVRRKQFYLIYVVMVILICKLTVIILTIKLSDDKYNEAEVNKALEKLPKIA